MYTLDDTKYGVFITNNYSLKFDIPSFLEELHTFRYSKEKNVPVL